MSDKKRKPKTMWAGFVNGKLYVEPMQDSYGRCLRPALFLAKRDARLQFQDVRKVEIREIGGPS